VKRRKNKKGFNKLINQKNEEIKNENQETIDYHLRLAGNCRNVSWI